MALQKKSDKHLILFAPLCVSKKDKKNIGNLVRTELLRTRYLRMIAYSLTSIPTLVQNRPLPVSVLYLEVSYNVFEYTNT